MYNVMGYVVDFNNSSNIKAAFINNGTPDPEQYSYNLTSLEEQMRDDAISRLNTVNPNHRYMTFGFITDLHTPGSAAGTGAYYNNTALPSIKLLGSIAYEFGIDAVLVGGDLASGAALDRAQYDAQIDVIKGYFTQYIPCTYYLTDGNHDRKYNSLREMRTNAEWLATLNRFNDYKGRPVTFAKDVEVYDVEGNRITEDLPLATYYVDFNEYKVRLASISSYDREGVTNGGASAKGYYLGTYASLMFSGSKNADEWIFGAFTHDNSSSSTEYKRRFNFYSHWLDGTSFMPSDKTPSTWVPGESLDRHKFDILNSGTPGKGVIGEISGHIHPGVNRSTYTTGGYTMPVIQTDGALYGSVSNGLENQTLSNYCFSIFVIRTDQMKLYELEVGKHRDDAENGIRVYDIARGKGAPVVSDDVFRFYHISDSHTWADSLAVCDALMDANPDVKFTILTGDYANTGSGSSVNSAMDSALAGFKNNLLVIDGNHEGWDVSFDGTYTYKTEQGMAVFAKYIAEKMNNPNINWGAIDVQGNPAVPYYYIDYQLNPSSKLRIISVDAYEYWYARKSSAEISWYNSVTTGSKNWLQWKPIYSQRQTDWIISCLVGRAENTYEAYKVGVNQGYGTVTQPAIDPLSANDYVLVAIHEPPIGPPSASNPNKITNLGSANSFCSTNMLTGSGFTSNNEIVPIIIDGYTHGSNIVNRKVLNHENPSDPSLNSPDSMNVLINADFSAFSQNHATFLGYLCGHLHGDLHTWHPDYPDQLILCIDSSTHNADKSGWTDIYDNATTFYRNSAVLINDVTLDFTNRKIIVTRIGNGSGKDGYSTPVNRTARDTIEFDMK